jgi:hypothetical protein
MSIATNTRRLAASAGIARTRTAIAERAALTSQEELREMRALLRHFVLAFAGAAAILYAAIASGLTV